MNKAYLLAICLLLTPFTGCIEDPALEPAENVDEPDNTEEEKSENEEKTEVRPTEQWTFYRDFVECDPNNDSIVAYGEFVDCLNMDLVNDGESVVAASSEFANEMFNIADLDMDGNLTSSEFDYIKNYPHELIKGCMNSTANNYNANATEEDNTCDYDLDDDGILDADEILGCTNSTANNYNAEATEEDNTCDYDLDDDGVLDTEEILGCTDSTAYNYNAEATEEDNTCIFNFQPETRDELKTAVDEWIANSTSANSTYGEINTWDTSLITNMSNLFRNIQTFNDNISTWDVSSVTEMEEMFAFARSFNQNISGWDVSSVTNMYNMFNRADSFNQDISDWDVSSVTNIASMFANAQNIYSD
jgi:surface protein